MKHQISELQSRGVQPSRDNVRQHLDNIHQLAQGVSGTRKQELLIGLKYMQITVLDTLQFIVKICSVLAMKWPLK